MVRIVAVVVLVALLAMPAAALGAPAQQAPAPAPQQNLIGEQPVPAPAPTQTAPTDNGTIGTGELALIGLAIAGLIGGIWLVISRDARRVTAGRRPTTDAVPSGGSATRASRRSRKPSAAERQRRKRGRAR